MVDIAIGPVPGHSARSWLATASATVAAVRARPELEVPDDVLAAFDHYLGEWDRAAHGETFHWHGTVNPAVARRLASHWLRLVTIARDRPVEETGIAPAPPEAQPFFEALAVAMATASAVEDDESFTSLFEEAVPAFDERRNGHDVAGATRVLIVDDNEDIRLLFRSALEFEIDFEVCGEATNGAEALDVAAEVRPDAVLLDVNMPVMDGLTALPLLHERCPAARIVVVTAGPTAGMAADAVSLGASDVLHKTASLAVLKRALRE